jgi:hypothetical protein
MKLKFYALILAVSAVSALTGCNTIPAVPATQISFNPKTGTLSITSPKNVCIGGVSVLQSSNSFALSVTNYTSTNDLQVVSAVVTAQALVASNASTTITALANLGAAVAAKAP